MLFAEDIPASHLAQQANDKGQTTLDTCGLGLGKPLASYDPDTQLWKMFGDISLWGDSPLLETLPPSGMTQNGVLYQQPAWEPITSETESLSWPTPLQSDWKPRGPNSKHQGLLETVKTRDNLWPTPRNSTAMSEDTQAIRKRLDNGKEYKSRLEEAVALNHYLAEQITDEQRRTMQAGNGGKLNPMWVEWLMGFPTGLTDLKDSETL